MCWIDNCGFTCLVVRNEVGIIVAGALPCISISGRIRGLSIKVLIHIGIDWICMAREMDSCMRLAQDLSEVGYENFTPVTGNRSD